MRVPLGKRDTLKIDVPFEDAVKAFLQTPPPRLVRSVVER